MTPTLYGRWQTRLLLTVLCGIPVTFLFTLLYHNARMPFVLLGYATLFGFSWDTLYHYLQTLRWNRDWPPLFAFYAGLWEGSFLFLMAQIAAYGSLQGWIALPGLSPGVTLVRFWLHYGTVFLAMFIASLGLLQVLSPRWRYRGGQWMSGW